VTSACSMLMPFSWPSTARSKQCMRRSVKAKSWGGRGLNLSPLFAMPAPKSTYRITYCPQCRAERVWILIRRGLWQCYEHIVEDNPWQSDVRLTTLGRATLCAVPLSDSLGTTAILASCSGGGSLAPSELSQETLPGLSESGNATDGGQDDQEEVLDSVPH
jgi:hypothetical protein